MFFLIFTSASSVLMVTVKRKDIEGLRAIAVGLVVLNHAGVPFLRGGFVGVDVFFVVSGFLITSLLLNEGQSSGTVHLLQFWARRARRILPMSLVVTMATVVAGLFMLQPGNVRQLSSVGLGSLGFSANFVLFFTTSDYLADVTAPSPLRHMWSLAVEEQFYLVWPLVVFACISFRRSRWRLWVGGFGLVAGSASFVTSVLITQNNPGAGYYLPTSRFWEIAAGSLLAVGSLQVDKIPSWVRAALGWIGMVGIAFASALFSERSVFPGYIAMLPVLATVAVLLAGDSGWGPRIILSVLPLQWIGARSYSLYLWHWPVLVLAEQWFGTPSALSKVGLVAVSVGLTMASYRYIEQPVRHNAWLSANALRSLKAAGVVTALALSSVVVLFAVSPRIDAGAVVLAEAEAEVATIADVFDGLDEQTMSQPKFPNTKPATVVVKPVSGLLIGDSVMAGLRWFEQGDVSLKNFTYTVDVESCRRLASWSCFGREFRTPKNVAAVVQDSDQSVDYFVLMAGYDSSLRTLKEDYQKLFAVVEAKGIPLIALTFKESLKFPAPGSRGKRSIYSDFNEVLREQVSANNTGLVTMAEWNAYSAGQESWFTTDGIHLTLEGTLALGGFVSTLVAIAADNPCPYVSANPCTTKNHLIPSTDFLQRFAVKDTNIHCYEDGKSRKKNCTVDRRN